MSVSDGAEGEKMSVRRLIPPLDLAELNEFADGLLDAHGRDIRSTIQWLSEHNSMEALVAGIRSAWTQSILPLRDWATGVCTVQVEVPQDDLRLVVGLSGSPRTTVRQAAPFTPQGLAEITKSFPSPIPESIAKLALAAPGLHLEPLGSLAEPDFFVNRLGYLTFWLRDTEPSETHRHGFEYVDAERQLMEVAFNGIGDCYAINMDGSMVFLDHEARGIVPCNVRLEELIEAYFESPESIVVPYERGWAALPTPPKPVPRQRTPADTRRILRNRQRQLTVLGSLAVAVRGCQRALAYHHLRSVPGEWEHHDQILARLFERCSETVMRGVPLDAAEINRLVRVSRRATEAWKVLLETVEVDYSAILLAFHATPALLHACGDFENGEKLKQAIASCTTVKAYHSDLHEESSAAAFQDIESLINLKLGLPGTIGQPVPKSFFDRPLWPEGLGPRER